MSNILEYIKSQETYYQTQPVPVVDGYEWNMFEHIKRTTLYLNSQYSKGKPGSKPFKNIILPKVNLEHRAVEFALREIEFFIDDKDQNYKSFLVRKYHDRWARNNEIPQFLDDMTECYTDYGGVLVKNTKEKPVVVPLQQIAFCDQTDLLSGPIGLKHQYSPDKLLEMASAGWGNPENGATHSLEEVIAMGTGMKEVTQANGQVVQTPGRYIEIYEIHGTLADHYLYDNGEMNKFTPQFQVVARYTDKDKKEQCVALFRKKEVETVFDAFIRDPIYGRALGRGGVEELFEPQVWVNYSEIQRKEYLDQASKIIYQTADRAFTTRNNTAQLNQGDVLVHADGKPATVLNNGVPNITAFENAIAAWDENAKQIASAQDTVAGNEGKSGMPFRLGMLLNQEGHSLHQYRKGKLGGIFLPRLYRNWIIPKMQKEMLKGDEFLSTLTIEEMQEIADQVIASVFNQSMIKKVLGGEEKPAQLVAQGEQESLLETYKRDFFKSGNKKFITILEQEMKDLPLDMTVNVTDENKNYSQRVEKLSYVFNQAAQIIGANPNFFVEHPEMAKLFNDIIETSGLSPVMFGVTRTAPVPALATPGQPAVQPNAPLPAPSLN